MRIFRVPPAYAQWLEGEVSRAADQANLDAYRRQNGHAPVIPDAFINEGKGTDGVVAVETFAVVTTPSDTLPDVVRRVTEAARPRRARRPA